jgi:hypothetical protein
MGFSIALTCLKASPSTGAIHRLQGVAFESQICLPHKKDETSGATEFLRPYPAAAADALLEIGTAMVTAALSLDERLSQTDIYRIRSSVASRRIVVLFSAFSTG